MVNQRIFNIIWELPIYPVSWNFREPSDFKSGIMFKVTKDNLTKTISIQARPSNLFDIEIFNSLAKREYFIEEVEPYDIVNKIDDYMNGDSI